jgi:hypothetical protein
LFLIYSFSLIPGLLERREKMIKKEKEIKMEKKLTAITSKYVVYRVHTPSLKNLSRINDDNGLSQYFSPSPPKFT